jgi:hypothetical protein
MGPDDDDPIDPADELMFLCLGGGNEVGRSCHILQYKGKTVMVRRLQFHHRRPASRANAHSSTPACILPTRASRPCPSMMISTSAP